MMRNLIRIEKPHIESGVICCAYEVVGPWIEAFSSNWEFRVEYDIDISAVPAGVALVPLLANVLPMAWVYDAEVEAPVCDEDFLNCVEEIRRSYAAMYPNISFGGTLKVDRVERCSQYTEGAICLFSGGVDAFSTLIQHIGESPTLFTLCGSDISLDDVEGWRNVKKHVESVSRTFGVSNVSAASTFRTFLNEGVLTKKVVPSGDNWWHGFQHGLGILGHVAPIAWALRKRTVYIASSFTAADKGKVTCASDPTIDNFVRYCGAQVVHDGYEFCRQDKVTNIVRFARNANTPVRLRVCWESKGGSNCCHCEKCLRTILAIYAEGADPRDFGFDYDEINRVGRWFERVFSSMGTDARLLQRYVPIQEAMRRNLEPSDVDEELRWFYEGDLVKLVHSSLPRRALRKVALKIRTVLP